MGDLLKSIRGGNSLAEAMAKHQPRPFSRLDVNMVRAGEKGGVLEPTLKRLAELLEESQEFKETLVSALIYPILLTLAGTGAVVFLLTFVIPRFVEIFRDLGAVPPPGDADPPLAEHGPAAVLVAARARRSSASSSPCASGCRRRAAAIEWDRIVLRLPLVGDVILKSETARFTRVLGTLLKSGVPVLDRARRRPRARGQPGARAAPSSA